MTISLSYLSMNRVLEERVAKDVAFRRTLERKGRPLLSHGRGMSDDALLGKLRSLGLDADRSLGLTHLIGSLLLFYFCPSNGRNDDRPYGLPCPRL